MNAGRLNAVDRALYALYSRRADDARHDDDRRRYRGTTVTLPFEVYLARVYGLSWLAGILMACLVVAGALVAPERGVVAARALPLPVASVPVWTAALALLAGGIGKRTTVWLGGTYLGLAAKSRRTDIERTLPGAVRYLRALATGSAGERAMLQQVAEQEGAYGETAVACRSVVNKTALTGSFDTAVRLVARDTPSQEVLAPFLLKFREYAAQGSDAVEDYLRLEGRMLSRRQERARERAEGFLELLAELFIVLLVLPTLLVIVLTVLSVLTPALAQPVSTPLGETTPRVLLVYGSVAYVLVVGAVAAWLVAELRPPNVGAVVHEPSGGWRSITNATRNPADAAIVLALPACALAVGLFVSGVDPANAALAGYVAFGLPVGAVELGRAQRDDAKDREMKDFVHAVAGHVSLGRPFPEAVERVAREVDLGALDDDVTNLAFNLGLTSRGEDVRTEALETFVADVGTPLAEQTVGLVTGALDAGSDPETVFDTLQAEIGRLYHERKALRSSLLVYVAVGWTTGVLIVGVMVAVNTQVLGSFERLGAVTQSMGGFVLDPNAIQPERDRYRFYLVTQATMLACGWFAGYASRGRFEALFHSAALVAIAAVAFVATGAL